MAVFKCKMCGGTLGDTNETVAICDYCGTKQTLPKLSDEHSAVLYERADHFRRNNDFDNAISIYEQILNEDNTDAEAYWSLVLCRYGIEYVDDPKDNRRIATVNRMQYTSVLSDEDYKSALKYADAGQKAIYEEEAREIDTIQKGILAISQREEPFDVFICYKETDDSGRRTPDSVLANELYHQLTGEGFKVFFSRITLEDKLGTAYEPYIFAALNSAKVMVVIGTKPAYFNAVWVRNEWSRYLALIKNGANKVLIPAYRDMDPYDLPEEFSHLQAQDMSKLGFMQDLIRGIQKLTGSTKKKEKIESFGQNSAQITPLLRRVFLFLEDGNWGSADEYCEKVLDLNPECGEAYLGKMMAALKVRRRESLSELSQPFDNNDYYQKAIRFGNATLQDELKNYLSAIADRIERNKLLAVYKQAEAILEAEKTEESYRQAAELFESIPHFEDSKSRAEQCKAQAYEIHFGGLYAAAVRLMKSAKTKENFVKAGNAFREIKEYKDSEQLAAECDAKGNDAYFGGLYFAAIELMKSAKTKEDFTKAKDAFLEIKEYRDSEKLAEKCEESGEYAWKNSIYTAGLSLMTGTRIRNYKKAIAEFEKIPDFKDSAQKIELCHQTIEQINAGLIAANYQKEYRAKERAEAFREKLPLIKKISFVVVPILVVAILLTVVIPRVDWNKIVSNDVDNGGNHTDIISTEGTTDFTSDIATVTEGNTDENSNGNTDEESAGSATDSKSSNSSSSGASASSNSSSGSSSTTDKNPSTSPSVPTPGTISSGLKWRRSGNSITITGYQGSPTVVEIPSNIEGIPVTSIGDSAFLDCKSLTSVTIPNSVTSIGELAFSWCTSLTSVTIPNSVTSIGNRAFHCCKSLTSVTIPNSVTSIGEGAFNFCESLTSVTIPNSVTSIGERAFYDCTSLTSVTISNGVRSIGSHAFYSCQSLTSVTIPNSVTSIGEEAFASCQSLTSVTIPNSVMSIENYTFAWCESLTSVTISNGVTSIGSHAFYGCQFLTSVTIPNSVTSIGEDAFAWCESLTSVTIPNSVTSIGEGAFDRCYDLNDVWYKGSKSDQSKISIGSDNGYLWNATWHYDS